MSDLAAALAGGRALSVRQPWAWAICRGWKDVENRTWPSRFRGPLHIHACRRAHPAGLGRYDDVDYVCRRAAEMTGRQLSRIWREYEEEVRFGALVGLVEMVDCVESSESPWFQGPFGFVFRNARPIAAVRMPGRLGIFRL